MPGHITALQESCTLPNQGVLTERLKWGLSALERTGISLASQLTAPSSSFALVHSLPTSKQGMCSNIFWPSWSPSLSLAALSHSTLVIWTEHVITFPPPPQHGQLIMNTTPRLMKIGKICILYNVNLCCFSSLRRCTNMCRSHAVCDPGKMDASQVPSFHFQPSRSSSFCESCVNICRLC